MVKKKTTAQLRNEIASLKKKRAMEAKKKMKLMEELKEKKKLERELRELKSSGALKQLKAISRKRPTQAQLKSASKKTKSAAKTTYKVAGDIVNRLSKINI